MRYKSNGTIVSEFVKFNIITLQYCKLSEKKINQICVVSGVTKKNLCTLEQDFISSSFPGVYIEE